MWHEQELDMDEADKQVKAVFAEVAAEAKRKVGGSGWPGLIRSAKTDPVRSCVTAAIDIICESAFHRWRADARSHR